MWLYLHEKNWFACVFDFSYDFLSVYDGPTTMDVLISDLTGSYVGGDLRDLTTTSTNSSMLLNFKSDSSDTGRGFILRVNAGKSNMALDMNL